MSKKQIHSRLETFFSKLAGDELPPSNLSAPESGSGSLQPPNQEGEIDRWAHNAKQLAGWAWELDQNMRYTFCGPELKAALGIDPFEFLGQKIFDRGLQPEAINALESALQGSTFPIEVNVEFTTARGGCLLGRMGILARTEMDGKVMGWRGFAQMIDQQPSLAAEINPLSQRQPPIGTPDAAPKQNGKTHVPVSQESGETPEYSQSPHLKGEPSSKPAAPPPPSTAAEEPNASTSADGGSTRRTELSGFALAQGELRPASEVWTKTGLQSLEQKEMSLENASPENPAVIGLPLQMKGVGDLLLEIVDDNQEREWSEDDRFLVMEVASQLSLALDNARLYIDVQQELADRIRAEQAILRRNKDLATLNRTGHQLSRLASREEIFNLLAAMVDEVLASSDLFICTFDTQTNLLTFPVARRNRQSVKRAPQVAGDGIAEYVMHERTPLLVTEQAAAEMGKLGITAPEQTPASVLAIPMIAGERAVGAIVAQDFEHENAFDAIQVELLSTAAAQATTALENADLFQQMQYALDAIENRERYQANVARSAAVLTEFGTKSMGEVLKSLGQAAECSRVYFAQLRDGERGPYWTSTAEWTDPSVAYQFDKTHVTHLPVEAYPAWNQQLREKGWVITQAVTTQTASAEQTAESELLNRQHIQTSLLLAVPGPSGTPGFLAFDQLVSPRTWQNEEISVLRVAADAISNTFVREGLLDQLQVTLDETESLYKASNRLAAANDMQEMVAAVLSSTRAPEINRAILLLFEQDNLGKIARIAVGASWYSGRGTPPPPVGTEYLRSSYERFFQTASPQFFENIYEAQIDADLRSVLAEQNIRALALLPLWAGKRQTGVLLLQSESKHIFSGREVRTYPPLVDQMAVAVENQRLFEQTQVALSETELLYNISNLIAQAPNAQTMLAPVVQETLPKGADRAGLILINSNPEGELIDLEIIGFQDINGDNLLAGVNIPVAELPLVKALTDEPLIISDVRRDATGSPSRQTLERLEIASGVMVPLRSGGRLTGILMAASRNPVDFTLDDTRLLRIVGNGIAVALEKQRLLRQAQRRALELQTASEIARDTASTLSLDLLLNNIVEMLSERFGFYHASIFLLDEFRNFAQIREATGAAGAELKKRGYRLAVGSRSVVGTVTSTGQSYILNDTAASEVQYANPLLPETRSEMGIPLKLGENVIGALDLQSKETNAFNQDDVTVLQILADQIAIAIENARAYELSQRAIEDMREVDRVKSQFLANMSHELRTPLNSIIGFSRVILKGIDGPINETQKQDLTAIYSSGQHLLNLITDILDLSKIEAGKMELAFSEINLTDLINSAMSTAVGLVKDKPIRLNVIVPEDMPLVRADNTRVRQVLINFLSNAAKFTDEGSITVEASYTSGPTGSREVMVAVTDTGPGIAAQDQGKLFLPFSQVDDSPTRKTGGTGLGLSICRSLIEMHGGQIGLLHSEVGKGSTFFFTLPLTTPEPVEPVEIAGGTGYVVLAVDDDPKVISLYERYLKPHGYQIVAVNDPKRALERAKEVRPFAITLDVMMPEKDGWMVLRDLKNDPMTRDIPIIMCSILENQERGFNMGASDYLVKPFLQEEMINALNRLNQDGKIREVLVIDDDPADLRLVQKMLEDQRAYLVTAAEGGVQGWEVLQVKAPDAVILDLFMPDMNGFEVLQNMRTDLTLKKIPVIVLTGADLTPEQHRMLTESGQGILAKNTLRENELLVELEGALRKFQPKDTRRS